MKKILVFFAFVCCVARASDCFEGNSSYIVTQMYINAQGTVNVTMQNVNTSTICSAWINPEDAGANFMYQSFLDAFQSGRHIVEVTTEPWNSMTKYVAIMVGKY